MTTPIIRLTRNVPSSRPQRGIIEGVWLLFVAVYILAFTLTLKAQTFPASDSVLMPAIGSANNGSVRYASDVTISNLSADDVAVNVLFTPANTPNPVVQHFPGAVHLKAGQRLEFIDFTTNILHVAGFGMAYFNGCKEGVDCTPDPTTGLNANYRSISIESRIYSSAVVGGPTVPTVGQNMQGIPWRMLATADTACGGCAGLQTLMIVGIRDSAAFHTNIGIGNASEFSSCYLTVNLYDGTDGGLRDTVNIRLGPLASRQAQNVVDMLPKFTAWSRLNRGRPVTNAVVTITQSGVTPTSDAEAHGCPDGCPAFVAYGSLIDNQTQDVTTLEAQFPYELNPMVLGLTSISKE